MANAYISSFTELTFLNVNTRAGTVILPSTNIPGRILTFKDRAGTLLASSITFSTASATQFFENNSRQLTYNDPFGSYSFVTGTDNKWYTIGGSRMDTAAISSITAINSFMASVSTGAVTTSTLQIRDFSTRSTNTLFLRSTNIYYSSPTNFFVLGPGKAPKPLQMRSIAQFQPPQLSGLSIWLDAADQNTIIATNNLVSQWNDKSSNNRNFTQGTISRQPIYNSADRFLLFDGTDDFLLGPLYRTVYNNLSAFNVFLVGNALSITTNVVNPFENEAFFGDSGGYHSIFVKTGLVGSYYYNTNNISIETTQSFSAGSNSILQISLQNSQLNNGLNGNITSVSGTLALKTSDALFTIGTQYTDAEYSVNRYLNSRIYEVVIYNVALTDIQRQQVEGYLAWKWGLVGNLPAAHPYKNAPP